jgi:hypothetical protein
VPGRKLCSYYATALTIAGAEIITPPQTFELMPLISELAWRSMGAVGATVVDFLTPMPARPYSRGQYWKSWSLVVI